ncbi:MAG: hypothetical protein AABW79_02340 [Nanoarchaeota archaeon]
MIKLCKYVFEIESEIPKAKAKAVKNIERTLSVELNSYGSFPFYSFGSNLGNLKLKGGEII